MDVEEHLFFFLGSLEREREKMSKIYYLEKTKKFDFLVCFLCWWKKLQKFCVREQYTLPIFNVDVEEYLFFWIFREREREDE